MNAPGPVGIALVDKPTGLTSHDVVARLRYHLGTRKVGHAGTLDPMATGLLVIGVGQGTKLLTYAVGLDKTYEATIRLGVATITDDAEGDETGPRRPADGISDDQIAAAVEDLTGDILQVPSAVSAIKVNGQRSYARVRAGDDVQLEARPIRVARFEVTGTRRQADGFCDIDAVIDCSSGTYIRALARDLGEALGVGGHLTALRRTHVGKWSVQDAGTVPERDAPKAAEDPSASPVVLRGLGEVAGGLLPVVPVGEADARSLRFGQMIHAAEASSPEDAGELSAAVGPGEDLVAIVEPHRGRLRPATVFPA
ncbi:tRNA pseudouridine(55) synthase TruB [Helcobacillus massiliensis]|uniref:tRNA pseudouridine(55) synthase TruB n=1 Tax=Helcobacillus massiliensis TaxID=521392 RepID=UPI0021A560FA